MDTLSDISGYQPVKSLTPHGNLPLVDREVLLDLERQLDDPSVARNFAEDFIDLWSERHTRLAAAVAGRDQAASLDVVRSIKITSTMVGAARLARFASNVEDAIRQLDMAAAAAALSEFETCGLQTVEELRSYL